MSFSFIATLLYLLGLTVLAFGLSLLIWRHRSNITKLLNGTESKLGSKAGKPSDSAT